MALGRVKKYLRVKDGSASYLLWVKKVLGLGQDSFLKKTFTIHDAGMPGVNVHRYLIAWIPSHQIFNSKITKK